MNPIVLGIWCIIGAILGGFWGVVAAFVIYLAVCFFTAVMEELL